MHTLSKKLVSCIVTSVMAFNVLVPSVVLANDLTNDPATYNEDGSDNDIVEVVDSISQFNTVDQSTVYDEYNESMENKELRTENSKTYCDGSDCETIVAFEPIHYLEGDEYLEIENTLSGTNNFSSKNNPSGIVINNDGSRSVLDGKINIDYLNSNDVKGKVNGNTVYFEEFYDGIDLELTLSNIGITQEFIIKGPTELADIEIN